MTYPTDEKYGTRHPSVRSVIQYMAYDHLDGDLYEVSRHCWLLAEIMLDRLDDGPELVVGLRKLLETKDCFVRAALTPGSRPA